MSTSTTESTRTGSEAKPGMSLSYARARIASLSPVEIESMDRSHLVEIVRESGAARSTELEDRLEFVDRLTLERLVYLARRRFRNRGY